MKTCPNKAEKYSLAKKFCEPEKFRVLEVNTLSRKVRKDSLTENKLEEEYLELILAALAGLKVGYMVRLWVSPAPDLFYSTLDTQTAIQLFK